MRVTTLLTAVAFCSVLSFQSFGQSGSDSFDDLPLSRQQNLLFYSRPLTLVETKSLAKEVTHWDQMVIRTKDGLSFQVEGTFQISSGKVYVRIGKKVQYLLPELVEVFKYKEHQFYKLTAYFNDQMQQFYGDLISSGPISLYAKYTIKMGGDNPSFDKLLQQANHLFFVQRKESKEARFLVSTRKAILKSMPDQHSKMKAYLKKEKPSLNKRQDLQQLFDYYNQL